VVLDATPEEANIFLDLGFDSIQIVEITAELESSLGVELPMQRWLDEQSYLDACSFTVASLIELCSAVVRDAEKEETP
jgi:acyl carrier protein